MTPAPSRALRPGHGRSAEAGIDQGYIYFAMAFSLLVEVLNMRYRRRAPPVALHRRFEPPTERRVREVGAVKGA